jgi:hypothetical protein
VDHERGVRERCVDVSFRDGEADGDVVVPALVDDRRVGGHCMFERGHGRLGVVLDLDELRRVLGDVAALCDDDGHRLSRVERLVGQERRMARPQVRS